MKKTIILALTCVVILTIAGIVLYPRIFPATPERKILYWTDPMLPGDRSDHPGKSPMGMERTPVYADAAQAETGLARSSEQETYYTCPMHPSVRKSSPGACPVCGMSLVKKTKPKEASVDEVTNLRRVSLSPAQRVIANVATTEASRSDIHKEITAVGVVDFAEPLQAKVTARFGGRIEKLYVNFTGEKVKAGQPLFDLYSPDLISAEQELILAANALSDSLSLDPNQQQLLDASRQQLHLRFGMTLEQISEIEQSHKAHESMTYRSPISGTVLSKDIQQGQYVSEGMLLYQLADLSRVWVYLDVYERDVSFITLHHRVQVTTESATNKSFTGEVAFIDPVINPETRTVRVRAEFANPTSDLKPQMYVRAQIHVPSRNTLTIPASAVMYTGKKNIVWVEAKENTFEPHEVTVGVSSGQSIEILDGLQEGDNVVSSGGFMIESESQLQQPAAGEASEHRDGSGGDTQE